MVRLEVTLDIYSGRPNPSWEMPEDKVKEFFEIKGWKEIINPEDYGVSLGLGYRGFVVSVISEDVEDNISLPTSDGNKIKSDVSQRKKYHLPSTFRIYGSKALNEQNINFKPSLSSEETQEKEKWLLQTYTKSQEISPGLVPTLTEYVEQTISNGGAIYESSKTEQEIKRPSKEELAACNFWSAYYNPAFWNDPYSVNTNNCYNYAANWRSNTTAQPGRAHNCSFSMDCSSVFNAATCDGLFTTCGVDSMLVALVIWPPFTAGDPTGDYHWYHWHGAGSDWYWGHKPGHTPARNWDDSLRFLIPPLEPHNCNRTNYTVFCGYYFLPKGVVVI